MAPMQRVSVERVLASEVRRGDRIWAPDDGDWFLVDRLVQDDDFGGATFFRQDNSLAGFDLERGVLRRVDG